MKSSHATYTGFEFETEGYPALAIINKDLNDPDVRKDFPCSVFIGIIPDSYNEYGHPEAEEYDYLNKVEREIIDYLETQTRSVHVGHTTVYRLREIIFYTRDKEAVENFLEHFLSGIERENHFELENDADWENVAAFYELL